MKGLQPVNRYINKKEARRIERSARPWEAYDLMKHYRESVNDDDVEKTMKEVIVNKQKIDKEREARRKQIRKTDKS